MTCKPGDFAVVIASQDPENIGRIVRVGWQDRGKSGYAFPWPDPVWWVEVKEPMVWWIAGRAHALCCGPVPDQCLQPLRGTDGTMDIAF